MPCDSILLPNENKQSRERGIREAIERLEAALARQDVTVTLSREGALAFTGWDPASRDRVTDACAYRKLATSQSWALRQAVSRAEAVQGRKLNERAIAAGIHSHSDGATWEKGH